MPEHCHFILFVEERMDCSVGEVIHGFKIGCNKALRAEIERQKGRDACMGAHRNGAHRNTVAGKDSEQGRNLLIAVTEDSAGTQPLSSQSGTEGSAFTQSLSSQSGTEGLVSPNSGNGYRQPSIPIKSKRMLSQHALFDPDFDETRLRHKGQLATMMNYIHNNPQHRWLKQHHKNLL